MKRIETDVLIVGAGPAGATAALALSRSGVRCIVVSKYRWSANGPRAHLINQRAMEVYRDLKVEDKILEQATPNELLGHNIFLESLTGIEYGRLYSWGNDPAHRGEYINASPTIHVDLPQDRLEPILITEAARLGAHVRFSTELTDLVQRDDSVTASVCDRLTDEKFEIRSAYMIGEDGANSRVAEIIGLPMVGETNLGVVVSALFKADLARFYVNWPGLLYWFFQPGGEGWSGGATFRIVRPWREWLMHFGFHPDHGTPDLSPQGLEPRIKALIATGDEFPPVRERTVAATVMTFSMTLGAPIPLNVRARLTTPVDHRFRLVCSVAFAIGHWKAQSLTPRSLTCLIRSSAPLPRQQCWHPLAFCAHAR